MSFLSGKKILLGVTGGIAAYKSALIIRHFRKHGAEVRVVMTQGAQEFITPLTLEVLSEHPVITDLFRPGQESQIGHIELARWPDAIVLAPASANVIAKLRHGLADDLLSTVLLATTSPVLVCPAMNTQMLGHPATQENLRVLQERPRVHLLEPDSGELACGETGAGRLPDPDLIEDGLAMMIEPKPLAGLSMLVSAGPTREPFGPVRYLSNPSTGKMGYALATKARHLGADVTLVSGPVALERPIGVERISVKTAAQMHDVVMRDRYDIVAMTAAVADYTPVNPETHKRKKSEGPWMPELARTIDILHALSSSSHRPRTLIGFAAETQKIEEYGRDKLERKAVDGIVANNVGGDNGAFGNDLNQVTLIDKSEAKALPWATKVEIAREICLWIAKLDEAKR